MENTYENKAPNRTRRAVFVFSVTFFCLILVVVLNFFAPNPQLAEITIEGAFAVIMATVFAYLGSHAVDRFSTGKVASMKKKLASSGKTYG